MIMKKYFLILIAFSFLYSCKEKPLEKPDNLIEKEVMINIIYDLSLLQAIKGVDQHILDSSKIDASSYVYKKYKIDSLQFAKSDQYYATENVKHYRKMYEKVNEMLKQKKVLADTLLKKENDAIKILPNDRPVKNSAKN